MAPDFDAHHCALRPPGVRARRLEWANGEPGRTDEAAECHHWLCFLTWAGQAGLWVTATHDPRHPCDSVTLEYMGDIGPVSLFQEQFWRCLDPTQATMSTGLPSTSTLFICAIPGSTGLSGTLGCCPHCSSQCFLEPPYWSPDLSPPIEAQPILPGHIC